MAICDWIRSNVDYGRNLVNGGLQGARSNSEATLDGGSLTAYLGRSFRESWMPIAVGAYIGLLGAAVASRRKPAYGAVAFLGLLGGPSGSPVDGVGHPAPDRRDGSRSDEEYR